ncbi:hypothetical protein AB0L53_41730 [Nonomuraea sp. NPDC052129]|uniref:hypothetical protein n=1 Tax=Nonomuraea sp. NPDC052129 TaxID=3154651 RepID=UPI003443DFAF
METEPTFSPPGNDADRPCLTRTGMGAGELVGTRQTKPAGQAAAACVVAAAGVVVVAASERGRTVHPGNRLSTGKRLVRALAE